MLYDIFYVVYMIILNIKIIFRKGQIRPKSWKTEKQHIQINPKFFIFYVNTSSKNSDIPIICPLIIFFCFNFTCDEIKVPV